MSKKILLIDDDRLVVKSLKMLLDQAGYIVDAVESGQEALELIEKNSFDLIISDIRMAGIDGIDTVKHIRKYLKKESSGPIPEIFITGYAEDENYQRIKSLEVTNVLYKPFDNSKFLNTVKKILARPTIPPEDRIEPTIEPVLPNIEQFFGATLPNPIKNKCKDSYLFEKLDQKQMMGVIDFAPPFLKIKKMAMLGKDRRSILQVKGLGMGIITPKETAGHYNETIFLAMCGWLMASAASVFLAKLFPTTAPQVVEANGIKPLPLSEGEKGLWKPAPSGTTFFVESTILKKKLQLVVMRTTISFDEIFYGVIEELKLMLTPKGSIWAARSLPPSAILRD